MDIREFKNTYKEHAPSLIWDWCAKPTAEEIDAKLMEFSDMGISSVFIRPSKGLVLPYLSKDYFELIRTAARRSAKYGISLWICDESSSSSGNGGGEITSVADYRMRDFIQDVAQKNDETVNENGARSFVLRDMSCVRASGRMPVADISDAFVTECFTEAVYDKYIRECKRFIGQEIKGFMTGINLPENAKLYSPSALKRLDGETLKSCGEKLLSKDAAFEERYNCELSNCIADNFTGLIKEKCNSNQMCLFTDVSGNEDISRQAQYIKSDCISLKVDSLSPDFCAIKLAESISAQFEKPFYIRLLMPSFAPCSQRHSAASFAVGTGAWGVIYDSVAFSLSDRRKYEPNTVTVSKFAEKDISERISRLSFVVKGTSSPANVLVIYSSEQKLLFENISKELLRKGIPYHMCEKGIFEKHACILRNAVTLGKCSYSTVISLKKINEFGGREIIIDPTKEISSYDFSSLLSSSALKIESDNDIFINRRNNGDDEYIFVTAKYDTCITAVPSGKSLFTADSSNGEIYRIVPLEDKCTFTLKSGKTALLIYSDTVSGDIAPPLTDDIEFVPHTALGEVPFALASADENILPLKKVNVCFGRKAYRESSIDDLHKEFYTLPDGETVKVKYPFTVDLKNVNDVKAYIENADNLDFVQLNGKALSGFTPSDKDPRFMGVDITPFLADGKNMLATEYKKSNNYTPDFGSITPGHFYSYNITSFEGIYLTGDFDAGDGALLPSGEYGDNVAASGMPYYYGALTYAAKLPESDLSGAMLKIHGDFDICRIKIGRREFTYFCRTPLIELFNLDCDAVAEITIYNTPHNLLRTSNEEAVPFGISKIELCKFSY